jgi:hypothetical protein
MRSYLSTQGGGGLKGSVEVNRKNFYLLQVYLPILLIEEVKEEELDESW